VYVTTPFFSVSITTFEGSTLASTEGGEGGFGGPDGFGSGLLSVLLQEAIKIAAAKNNIIFFILVRFKLDVFILK
jgi:hypothetical protein